jgi:ABC-type sugar transport system ATPase subunit
VSSITLERLAKRHANGHVAVRDVDLRIDDGEFVVLVGPSGCGKSTLLRLIAGLETPTSGRILLDDADVTGLPPQSRDLAMVFQSYALYPHMTVRQNLAYGLRVRGADGRTIDARLGAVAAALGLDALLDRRPAQLSGGQRQRVALGRAMVREPRAFLLDEPLSNLDPALRLQARAELLQLHRRLRSTVLYVTHDQEEAMTLGSRVVVMREGRFEQIAPPLDLYITPANTFVAQFIGVPPMNLVPGPVPELGVGAGVSVGIRPHDLTIATAGRIVATVDVVEERGYDAILHLRTRMAGGAPLVAVAARPIPPGTEVQVDVAAGRMHLFDERGKRMDAHRDGQGRTNPDVG